MSTILVTGATGNLGTIVVEQLLQHLPANQISVLVRDETKAAALKEKGVNLKFGNYQNTASLVEAMKGIDKVLLISSSEFEGRIGQHKNAVDAAREAGVKHIHYTSVAIKNLDQSPLKPLLGDHLETEAYIKKSGLIYTIFQNGLYADIIPMFLGADVLETGAFVAAGDGKVAFAARKDIGVVIGNILASEGHENKTYQLTNTSASSFLDITNDLSKLSGKTVNYLNPDPIAFEQGLKQFGLPEGVVLMTTLFAAGMKNNDFEDTNDTLERFLGRKQTDLTTFLKDTYQLGSF
jgi:NAD(P)H dehydrogenase (quinone)